MSVEHVEIDEVREEEAGTVRGFREEPVHRRTAFGVALGRQGATQAGAGKDVADLSNADGFDSGRLETVENGLGGRIAKVVAVRGAAEGARFAEKGTRDDPTDPFPVRQGRGGGGRSRRVAPTARWIHAPRSGSRNRPRCKGSVSGADVLLAEFLEDDSAGLGVVAEKGHPAERLHLRDERIGKPGKGGEGLGDDGPGEFPVTGDGVLSGGTFDEGGVGESGG